MAEVKKKGVVGASIKGTDKPETRIALIGLGYWGPNLLRTLNNMGVLLAAFDKDPDRLKPFATDAVYNNVHFALF